MGIPATTLGHTQRLADWGIRTALPFWAEAGWDDRHGGFFETLDFTGQGVYGDVRRVRTQARQVFVFARAHHEGWLSRLDLAEEGMATLKQRAWSVGGEPGWMHRLADDGAVLDGRRDLYDHAFVILALAWLHRATGDAAHRTLAYDTLNFVETRLASPHGGFLESLGGPQRPRRQNPHMHLFEALMALYEATGDAALLGRLEAIRILFDRHFHDPAHGVVREFFADDWSLDPESGDTVEPGHLCEWVWLLAEYNRLTGSETGEAGSMLYRRAISGGRNAATGLLCTAIEPGGQVLDASSRAWMQAEWIRAAAVRARAGAPAAAGELDRVCAAVFDRHLDPAPAGGWIDAIGRDGEPLSQVIPASTLYHLLGSAAEAATFSTGDSPAAAS